MGNRDMGENCIIHRQCGICFEMETRLMATISSKAAFKGVCGLSSRSIMSALHTVGDIFGFGVEDMKGASSDN